MSLRQRECLCGVHNHNHILSSGEPLRHVLHLRYNLLLWSQKRLLSTTPCVMRHHALLLREPQDIPHLVCPPGMVVLDSSVSVMLDQTTNVPDKAIRQKCTASSITLLWEVLMNEGSSC